MRHHRSLPWAVSATVHGICIGLTSFIIMLVQHTRIPDPPLAVHFVEPVQRQQEEVRIQIDQKRAFSQLQITETAFYTPEALQSKKEPIEEPEHRPRNTDLPEPDPGRISFFGVGRRKKMCHVKHSTAFGRRTPEGRQQAIHRYGGSQASEDAVNAALIWLASQQDVEGCWYRYASYTRGFRIQNNTQLGVTGLAVLAFLGAGHTEKHGTYKYTVRKALDYIMRHQGKDGGIRVYAHNDPEGYAHSICGIALAEAYGMAKGRTRQAAQRAVDYSVMNHQHNVNGVYSGWRYSPRQEPDTSVTGWFIMQLKSAKMSGLRVPGQGWMGAKNYLDSVTIRPGKGFTYDSIGGVAYRPLEARGKDFVVRKAMTAVGLVSRLFLGEHRGSPVVIGAARQMEKWPKSAVLDRDVYTLYYGTLGMFQMGGEHWTSWNKGFRDTLVWQQVKRGPNVGSWKGGVRGGRTYATAMNALTLEVYYRYLPMYWTDADRPEQPPSQLTGQKFKLKDGQELVGHAVIRSRETLLIRTTNGEIVRIAVNQLVDR